MKGYKLYEIATKFFVSHDVFHEGVFPFHFIISLNAVVDSFIDLVLPRPILDVPTSATTAHDSTSLIDLPSTIDLVPCPSAPTH